MLNLKTSRRTFLHHSALALALPSFPTQVLAQTAVRPRLEWQAFKLTPQYDSLLTAITAMKANPNPADPASWQYWIDIHINRCPHGTSYFLAWHRGYLFHFEKRLRQVSGNSKLMLPYWDYYTSAALPSEFTDESSPLYVPRVNTNVQQALTMAPFGPSLLNFQIGSDQAFEPNIEDAPHNPVHNIIGNVMADMPSPTDPIFWLHHANIDRLWVAWVAAGGGRKMPGLYTPYWAGLHSFTDTLSVARRSTYDTRSKLFYYYSNENFPAALPVALKLPLDATRIVQPAAAQPVRNIPPVGAFKISNPRKIDTAYAVGGALDVALNAGSIAAQIPISSDHANAISEILKGKPSPVRGDNAVYRSVRVVIDRAALTDAGRKGGYFYRVYLNTPDSDEVSNVRSLYLGTLGAFEINSASHRGVRQLVYPIKQKILQASSLRGAMASISFERVNGDNNPAGSTLSIAEVRIEIGQ